MTKKRREEESSSQPLGKPTAVFFERPPNGVGDVHRTEVGLERPAFEAVERKMHEVDWSKKEGEGLRPSFVLSELTPWTRATPDDRAFVLPLTRCMTRRELPAFGVKHEEGSSGSLKPGYIDCGAPFAFSTATLVAKIDSLEAVIREVQNTFAEMLADRMDATSAYARGRILRIRWSKTRIGFGLVMSSARLDYDWVPVFEILADYEPDDEAHPDLFVVDRNDLQDVSPRVRNTLQRKMTVALKIVRTISRSRLDAAFGEKRVASIATLGRRFDDLIDKFVRLIF